MIKIKIIQSSKDGYWYKNRIGEVFNVYDAGEDCWYIPYNNGELLFIEKIDAEIFDRRLKIKQLKSKM